MATKLVLKRNAFDNSMVELRDVDRKLVWAMIHEDFVYFQGLPHVVDALDEGEEVPVTMVFGQVSDTE